MPMRWVEIGICSGEVWNCDFDDRSGRGDAMYFFHGCDHIFEVLKNIEGFDSLESTIA